MLHQHKNTQQLYAMRTIGKFMPKFAIQQRFSQKKKEKKNVGDPQQQTLFSVF